jgi:hypothetical protein
MKRWLLVAVGGIAISSAQPASAQFGRLIKEGVEMVGKKAVGKTAREAAQEGSEQLLKKVVTEAGQETAEAVAKRAGITAARYTDEVAQVVGQHGGAVVAPIVNQFGDDGAKALAKLSTTNARRMAMLTDDLAAHGQGADWMKLLADKGDVVAEWIWNNKGTIAVATTATAFLANPDPFLHAGETVATTTIETAGEHVARPLIESTVQQAVPAAMQEVQAVVTAPMRAFSDAPARQGWSRILGWGVLLGLGYIGYRSSRLWSWSRSTS